jgi:glycosyltransferase involved in cell wall biosynthesis
LIQPLSGMLHVDPSKWLNPIFDRWAAKSLLRGTWDAIHVFSGIAENVLNTAKNSSAATLLVRASSHIRVQDDILRTEQERTCVRIDRPDAWTIAQEEKEYRLADRVVVLSAFALNSFLAQGFSRSRLRCLPLGASMNAFRPTTEVAQARRARILRGLPLQVLYTGAISMQKGFWDLTAVARRIDRERFRIRCVGTITPEARHLATEVNDLIEFTPKQPQSGLPEIYSTGDLFLFPTLQDGFPIVLAQANANGLPIITTPNCCGPEFIQEGKTGWIVPIREPQAIIDRLNWCDSHREELAEMVTYTSTVFQPRDWDDVARDFEVICKEAITEKRDTLVESSDGR